MKSPYLLAPVAAVLLLVLFCQFDGTRSSAQTEDQNIYLRYIEAPSSVVKVYEEMVTIRAYPYARHLVDVYSSQYHMTFKRLNRSTYQSSPLLSQDQTFQGVVLENEFLKLTVLPELGGRIYSCVFKPTGHNEFYRNPVLKPTHWGPTEQGWWLAAGGIEWCLPVEEHGYESAMPWLSHVDQSPSGATVTVADSTDTGRLCASVAIHLPAESAYFSVTPRVTNRANEEIAFQFWLNAMLAPGGGNSPSSQLEFVYPTTQMTVHSRDARWTALPDAGGALDWPVDCGLDLRFLGNWPHYLGCFERPAAVADFVSVYDHRDQEGIVRVFPSEIARGAKLFAPGFGANAIPAAVWTDDGSSYVEIHGGLTPTFGDYTRLSPGEEITWTEYWYPVMGLGGVQYANRNVALNLERTTDGVWIGISVTSPHTDTLISLTRCDGSNALFSATIPVIDPVCPYYVGPVSVPAGDSEDLCLNFYARNGALIASYRTRS